MLRTGGWSRGEEGRKKREEEVVEKVLQVGEDVMES